MNILMIETTGATASVAVINEQGIAAKAHSDETLNHLSFLMPLVAEALENGGLQMSDIGVVAASEGPGSFTGIRIGVSSARALAQALNLPCMGVPTLKTFLYNLEQDNDPSAANADSVTGSKGSLADKYKGVIFCPLFDARRSQVYGGAYCWGKSENGTDEICEAVSGKAYALEEILELLGNALKSGACGSCAECGNNADFGSNADCGGEKMHHIVFFGDGIKAYGEQIQKWGEAFAADGIEIEFADEAVRYQKAVSGAKLAMKLYKASNTCHYNDLKPNYMRQAEAQRKLEEAKAAEKRG